MVIDAGASPRLGRAKICVCPDTRPAWGHSDLMRQKKKQKKSDHQTQAVVVVAAVFLLAEIVVVPIFISFGPLSFDPLSTAVPS